MATATAPRRIEDEATYGLLLSRWNAARAAEAEAAEELGSEAARVESARRANARDTAAGDIAEGRVDPSSYSPLIAHSLPALAERHATLRAASGKAKENLDAFIHQRSAELIREALGDHREALEDTAEALEALGEALQRQDAWVASLRERSAIVDYQDHTYQPVSPAWIAMHLGELRRRIAALPKPRRS